MMKNYIISILILLCCVLLIFTNNLLFIAISIIIASKQYCNDKNMKKYMTYLFIIYIVALSYFTLFSSFYKRNFIGLEWNLDVFKKYVQSCNFVPFKTIIFYLKCFFTFSEQITQIDIFLNLVGNVICLIPLAIFIPFFFKNNKTRKKFSVLVISTAIFIEIVQFVTMTGSLDVDDIILNSSGCILFYLLFYNEINNICDKKKITSSKNGLKYFLVKLLLVIIITIITILSFIDRYYREQKYWNDYHFENIKIIDYENACKTDEQNLIYEDELYEYYINCDNPDKIQISINNNVFYLREYLQGKTMYPIIIHKLEDTGMEIEKKEKNEKIIICPETTVAIIYSVDNYEIAKLHLADYVEKNGKYCSVFYVIPVDSGSTNAFFEYDQKNENYSIKISSTDNSKHEVKIKKIS